MLNILLLCLIVGPAQGGWSPYSRRDRRDPPPNSGEPLILTPLLEAGRIEEARKLALVPPLIPNVTSYAGFLTVDKECNSNMFFWFFPAETSYETSPLSIWLQGGPGASSLYGLFNENGPLFLTPDGALKRRKFTWTHASSYLYIDNPVGTGFSFTNRSECYSRNETHVGQNLLITVKQFLALFPELRKAPLFVTGESYGGKYVPALAYAIHKDNEDAQPKINLTGIAIGNGLVDPGNQLHYGDYLYQNGLIDSTARDYFHQQEEKGRAYIAAGNWAGAFDVFDGLLNGDLTASPSYFKNCTGFDYYFNYLHATQPPEGDESAFVNMAETRKAIHVGGATFQTGQEVEKGLKDDMMQSVAPWLEELLEHYRVLIYNGQLDIIVAYPLTISYLQKLQWSGAEDYLRAGRSAWYVGKDVAGYVKRAGRLTEVLVRKAGHMVPADQPRWGLDLITRFIHDEDFPSKPPSYMEGIKLG